MFTSGGYALLVRFVINEHVTTSAYAVDSSLQTYRRYADVRNAARAYVAHHHGVSLSLSDTTLQDSIDESARLE